MTPKPYITRNGTNLRVQAVQVPDELGAALGIADWVMDNGGRTTEPLLTFGCVFRIQEHRSTFEPVQVGDWVVRYDDGTFTVMADEAFTEAFEPIPTTDRN